MTLSSPVVEAFVRNVPELHLMADAVQRAEAEASALNYVLNILSYEAGPVREAT